MSLRAGAARGRRAWALAALVASAGALPACDGDANVSVGVGVAVPAPWGGVAISTTVPVGPYGPYSGGRYGPMW